jgi:hypothetical protein
MNASRTLLAIAGIMYLVGWFLPVAEGGSKFLQGVPGWEALMVGLAPLWERSAWNDPSWSALSVLSAVTNLVMIGSLVPIRSRGRTGLLAVAFAGVACLAVNSSWFFRNDSDVHLEIGYYLWWWSFLPLAIGAFLLRRQLAAASR